MKYALENGIIDLQCIQQQIEMNKIEQILHDHPYNITQNKKNGRWYTRFDTKNGVVQRNRKTKEELEDVIVDFYLNQKEEIEQTENEETILTFRKAHDAWLEVQEKEYEKNPNTIYHYDKDWNRFFEGTSFSMKDVKSITPKDIEIFMINSIKNHNLKRKGAVTLYGYINGVFYNLVMDRIIPLSENPCSYVDKKKFKKYYNKEITPTSQRVYSAQDLSLLLDTLEEDLRRDELCLPAYGVKLALLTGMRSGEICGLKWDHISDNYIHICEAEVFNSITLKYSQSHTKTDKTRYIPITEELSKFLAFMKAFQEKNGCFNGFVISCVDKKLHTRRLSDYLIKRSKKLGFECAKNVHAIRRTFNSFLREDGVSALTAGSLIGNTVEVNNNHYTYDIGNLDQKKLYMTNAEMNMLNGRSII